MIGAAALSCCRTSSWLAAHREFRVTLLPRHTLSIALRTFFTNVSKASLMGPLIRPSPRSAAGGETGFGGSVVSPVTGIAVPRGVGRESPGADARCCGVNVARISVSVVRARIRALVRVVSFG